LRFPYDLWLRAVRINSAEQTAAKDCQPQREIQGKTDKSDCSGKEQFAYVHIRLQTTLTFSDGL